MIKSMVKKFIAISLLSLSSFLYLEPTVIKADTTTNNISIEGNATGLVTIPDQEWFLKKEKMLPGDSAVGTIKLENKYDFAYEIFLRAEDTENKSDYQLVNQLFLNISLDGSDIYSGALSGEDKMSKDISLGTIKPGECKIIDASVILDGKATGNVLKNKYASIEWIFTAVRVETNKVTIKDYVEEPQNKVSVLDYVDEFFEGPKTGDTNKGLLIFGSGFLLSATIAVITLKRRGCNHGNKNN